MLNCVHIKKDGFHKHPEYGYIVVDEGGRVSHDWTWELLGGFLQIADKEGGREILNSTGYWTVQENYELNGHSDHEGLVKVHTGDVIHLFCM